MGTKLHGVPNRNAVWGGPAPMCGRGNGLADKAPVDNQSAAIGDGFHGSVKLGRGHRLGGFGEGFADAFLQPERGGLKTGGKLGTIQRLSNDIRFAQIRDFHPLNDLR